MLCHGFQVGGGYSALQRLRIAVSDYLDLQRAAVAQAVKRVGNGERAENVVSRSVDDQRRNAVVLRDPHAGGERIGRDVVYRNAFADLAVARRGVVNVARISYFDVYAQLRRFDRRGRRSVVIVDEVGHDGAENFKRNGIIHIAERCVARVHDAHNLPARVEERAARIAFVDKSVEPQRTVTAFGIVDRKRDILVIDRDDALRGGKSVRLGVAYGVNALPRVIGVGKRNFLDIGVDRFQIGSFRPHDGKIGAQTRAHKLALHGVGAVLRDSVLIRGIGFSRIAVSRIMVEAAVKETVNVFGVIAVAVRGFIRFVAINDVRVRHEIGVAVFLFFDVVDKRRADAHGGGVLFTVAR